MKKLKVTFTLTNETLATIERNFGRQDENLYSALILEVLGRFFNETYWNSSFKDSETVEKFLNMSKTKVEKINADYEKLILNAAD